MDEMDEMDEMYEMDEMDEKKQIRRAILNDDKESVKNLLFYNGVNYYSGETTPLHIAVSSNRWNMFEIILRYAGTKIDAVDNHGYTSLYIACNKQIPNDDTIIYLLGHKANVNLCDKQGITPLMRASFYGNVPVMNLLIEAGANINAIDNNNCTAISFALKREGNNSDVLKFLLNFNAKLTLPDQPKYNGLLFAIKNKPALLNQLIPFCKNISEENFLEALRFAISKNLMNAFQTLMTSDRKISDTNLLMSTIFNPNSNAYFYLLWRMINHKLYVNHRTFAMLFYTIFQRRSQVDFFKNSLKTIIITPNFNFNLSDERLVISTIFMPTNAPEYDWILCKDILLEFIEYLNKQGLKLRTYDLFLFVQYFKGDCLFITELLMVFFKYDSELSVTMHDIITLNYLNDLDLTSLLLYNCFNFDLLYFSRSIYELHILEEFSVDMLSFFVQRFTPTNFDIEQIRSFEKFNYISLKVPTLMELARNAFRKTVKKNKLKEVIQNLHIASSIADILRFKTPVADGFD